MGVGLSRLLIEVGTGATVPPADPWAARDAMVWNVDIVDPAAGNVGILSTSLYNPTRTDHSGTFTVPAGDVSYDSHDFHGKLLFTTSGRKYFRNCFLGGNASPTFSEGAGNCTSGNVSNVIFEDCTFDVETPSSYLNGILGHHYTARRCLFRHGVDGCGVYNTSAPTAATGVLIELCYFEKHAFFNPDPDHADGSHCDGVQIQGGSGTIIRGNVFKGYIDTAVGNSPWSRTGSDAQHRTVSGIMITPNVGAITGCVIANNRFYGSEQSINATKSTNAGNNVGTFTNNWFEVNTQLSAGHDLDFGKGVLFSASGNVKSDGSPATIRTTI